MDELDENLLEAWHTVSELLQNRPWVMARWMERVARKEARWPVRAWCVALRAGDSRIGARAWRGGLQADRLVDREDRVLDLTGPRHGHEVLMPRGWLHELC
ncbi:MAG: hypothetical protein AAGI37_20715 [Planctomycetota bacterium]